MFTFMATKWFKKKFKRQKTFLFFCELIFLLFITGISFVVLFKYYEKISWNEAIWQVWQTSTTVGYGNQPAATIPGRIVTMIFGVLTIGILGTATATIFDYREELRNKRRLGFMENPYKEGIVMFNFPGVPKFLEFERELRAQEPDVGICIIDNNIEELPLSISILPKVHFVRSSILEEETYKKAKLKENKIVIIFPSNSNTSDSDATTKVVLSLVKNFIDKNTRIIYVLSDQRNSWMFKDVECTEILDSLEILALVQECQDPHTAPAVQRLLLNTAGANPITVRPNLIEGMSWGDLLTKSISTAKTLNITVNIFTLIHNKIPDPCPPYNQKITKEDCISIIADSKFNWDEFEKHLVKNGL